jgi:hypothetical protein
MFRRRATKTGRIPLLCQGCGKCVERADTGQTVAQTSSTWLFFEHFFDSVSIWGRRGFDVGLVRNALRHRWSSDQQAITGIATPALKAA